MPQSEQQLENNLIGQLEGLGFERGGNEVADLFFKIIEKMMRNVCTKIVQTFTSMHKK